jgi:hypothetical protein
MACRYTLASILIKCQWPQLQLLLLLRLLTNLLRLLTNTYYHHAPSLSLVTIVIPEWRMDLTVLVGFIIGCSTGRASRLHHAIDGMHLLLAIQDTSGCKHRQ